MVHKAWGVADSANRHVIDYANDVKMSVISCAPPLPPYKSPGRVVPSVSDSRGFWRGGWGFRGICVIFLTILETVVARGDCGR